MTIPPQNGQQPHYQQPQYAPPQYQQPQYAPPQYQPPLGPASYGPPGVGEPFDGAANPNDLTRPLYGATFLQSLARFFKNYANFSGRASRSEYWWVQLFLFLVQIVPAILVSVSLFALVEASSADGSLASASAFALFFVGLSLALVISLGLLLPTFAIGWRRLHDSNLPGPLYLLTIGSMIPFLNYIGWVGSLVVIILTTLGPKPEGRRFVSRA